MLIIIIIALVKQISANCNLNTNLVANTINNPRTTVVAFGGCYSLGTWSYFFTNNYPIACPVSTVNHDISRNNKMIW